MPSGTGLCEQPRIGSQASAVQMLPSSQVLGAPATHWPFEQLSPTVQALPSSVAPVSGAKTQPRAGSQLSAVQTLLSLQEIACKLPQIPAWQVPPKWHRLPSEQPVPSATGT